MVYGNMTNFRLRPGISGATSAPGEGQGKHILRAHPMARDHWHRGSAEVSGQWHGGSAEVPGQWHGGSAEVPGQWHGGSAEVPGQWHGGSAEVPDQWHGGLQKFQVSDTEGPLKFQVSVNCGVVLTMWSVDSCICFTDTFAFWGWFCISHTSVASRMCLFVNSCHFTRDSLVGVSDELSALISIIWTYDMN